MENNGNNLIHSFGSFANENGLTKREHFASLAMQGFMATLEPSTGHYPNFENVEYLAKLSVTAADQLLLTLETPMEDGK